MIKAANREIRRSSLCLAPILFSCEDPTSGAAVRGSDEDKACGEVVGVEERKRKKDGARNEAD